MPVKEIISDRGYQRGYSDGFKEGYNQAFQQFQNMLITKPQPTPIIISYEEYERIKKDL